MIHMAGLVRFRAGTDRDKAVAYLEQGLRADPPIACSGTISPARKWRAERIAMPSRKTASSADVCLGRVRRGRTRGACPNSARSGLAARRRAKPRPIRPIAIMPSMPGSGTAVPPDEVLPPPEDVLPPVEVDEVEVLPPEEVEVLPPEEVLPPDDVLPPLVDDVDEDDDEPPHDLEPPLWPQLQ
jgi:hypothetical protein